METNYAYLAGIIDGEGCIYFATENKDGKFLRNRIRLQVTNTNINLINKVKEIAGLGTISKGMQQKKNWKIRYDWLCYNRTATDILEKCLPYLIAKKEQAQAAINYVNGTVNAEETKKIIMTLNKKGV